MKTYVIIHDGDVQIDLVPEGKEEERILDLLPTSGQVTIAESLGYTPRRGDYLMPSMPGKGRRFTAIRVHGRKP